MLFFIVTDVSSATVRSRSRKGIQSARDVSLGRPHLGEWLCKDAPFSPSQSGPFRLLDVVNPRRRQEKPTNARTNRRNDRRGGAAPARATRCATSPSRRLDQPAASSAWRDGCHRRRPSDRSPGCSRRDRRSRHRFGSLNSVLDCLKIVDAFRSSWQT